MTYKDINILFEDNHLLVVVKPANLPVQADESGDVDLLTLLKQYLVEKYNKPGDAYLGLVHRLDRPTGGVMVFAKTSKAASRLSEAIRNNNATDDDYDIVSNKKHYTFDKKYLAIVEGTTREKSEKLTCYLKKFPETNMVKVVPQLTDGAKYAELDYKLLETKEVAISKNSDETKNLSLVSVNLVTGRTHQIRVQMSTIGNPILGDCRYGNGEKLKHPLCLWAYELSFTHPISGNQMVFRVYPPEEGAWTIFNMDKFLSLNAEHGESLCYQLLSKSDLVEENK